MGFAYRQRNIMRKSSGEPKSIEAEIESSNSEEQEREQEQTEGPDVPQADEPLQDAAANAEAAQSDDWWSASQQESDWANSAGSGPTDEVTPSKEPRTADVYFCGHTTFFPLNRALQAISKEKLTGLLRSFWEQEPIDLLARDGEIILVTARDAELYCPETPALLAEIDVVKVARARDQQRENGIPFFLILAREESISLETAIGQMQQYGQKLFSQLWAAPRVWIMFEKNADVLSDAA